MEPRRKKYPVDTASFVRIRMEGFVYVDKSKYIDLLTKCGKFVFLARPRRFGKSLFLDTLYHYFKGNRELFRGLEIERLQPMEWEEFPVLRFNMTGAAFLNPESLVNRIGDQLDLMEKEYGLEKADKTNEGRFENLIVRLTEKYNKNVVILIDEYDAPLSAAIGNRELQENYREQLHGFYSVLKNNDNHITFCMLTGVTHYCMVNMYGGLNNLNDITFSDEFAGICGITETELHNYYEEGAAELAKEEGISVDEAFPLLKFHYDGYHFSKSLHDVYNPFSINNALYNKEIKDYWCRSGLPTLLSKSLMHNDFDVEKLKGKKVTEEDLSDLSIYTENPVPLFYQTGYLTLKDYDPKRKRYTLGYPNREVETGILRNILNVYMPGKESKTNIIFDMEDAFEDGKPEEFIKIFSSFLADIPHQLHKHVDKYENYYHTIFYCMATLIGLDVDAEYSTSEGFIDMLIKTDKYLYIIELKINGTAEDAMRQIEEKHYDAPFEKDSRKIFKIGIGFSKTNNSINSSIII